MSGGFKAPLFILGLSSVVTVTQGGFRTPIPVLPIGGLTPITQAGFITPIPVLRMGAVIAAEILPEPVGAFRGRDLQLQIEREDEEIMAIIMAFMRMVD